MSLRAEAAKSLRVTEAPADAVELVLQATHDSGLEMAGGKDQEAFSFPRNRRFAIAGV